MMATKMRCRMTVKCAYTGDVIADQTRDMTRDDVRAYVFMARDVRGYATYPADVTRLVDDVVHGDGARIAGNDSTAEIARI